MSSRASSSQAAKTISTIILQAKALVVIKGKKKELETRNGMNGTRKSPVKTTFFRVFCICCMLAKKTYFDYISNVKTDFSVISLGHLVQLFYHP